MEPERRWSIVCVAIGVAMILGAFLQDNSRDGFAIAGLVVGAALIAGGVFLPRLLEFEFSPNSVKMKMANESRNETIDLSNDDPAEIEAAADALDEPSILPAVRSLLAWQTFGRLLGVQEEGPLAGCNLELYLYDADLDELTPVQPVENPTEAPNHWKVGTGATGTAYARGEYVLVEGDSVHDGTYGLSPDQQSRYANLTAVAAMPVVNASDQVIGVLTASTTAMNPALDEPSAFEEHVVKAHLIARVLIDILHWFEDQ